jgi:ELWxxDGT repeat protein
MHSSFPSRIAAPAVYALAVSTPFLIPEATAQIATRLGEANPVTASSDPENYVRFGAFHYFTATGNGGQRAIFRTAGTETSTVVAISSVGAPASLSAGDTKLYFAGDATSGTGRSLFVSDGTQTGTIELGPTTAMTDTVAVGDRLVAIDGRRPLPTRDILVSDGTPAGTASVPVGGPELLLTSAPRLARGEDTNGNPVAFVLTRTPFPGNSTLEVFVSDGTVSGTTSIAVSPPAPLVGAVRAFVPFAPGRVLALQSEGSSSVRVLLLDQATGSFTTIGTRSSPGAGPIQSVPFDGRVVFAPQDAEMFAADANGVATLFLEGQFLGMDNRLLGVLGGSLWATSRRSDGLRLIRLDPSSNSFTDVAGLPEGSPVGTANTLGDAFFVPFAPMGDDEDIRASLLRIETPSGLTTELATGPASALVGDLARINGRIVFRGFDDLGSEPWVTDGTIAGTRLLVDLRDEPSLETTRADSALFTSVGGRTAFPLVAGPRHDPSGDDQRYGCGHSASRSPLLHGSHGC